MKLISGMPCNIADNSYFPHEGKLYLVCDPHISDELCSVTWIHNNGNEKSVYQFSPKTVMVKKSDIILLS